MEIACFSITKNGLVRCTLRDRDNVELGLSGTRICVRLKRGRKRANNVPAAEKENSTRLNRFKKALI